MALTYLTGGESPTAALWNTVFAAANSKISAALDGKSFFIDSANLHSSLIGKVFCFGNGVRPYSSSLGSPYNHSTYTAAASAAAEVSTDDELGIMTVSGLNQVLHNSLQAHTRSGYYLQEDGDAFPEKVYKYAVAELIYEGIGFNNVLFSRQFNKYNFFRIHNLNYYAMQFNFETSSGLQSYTVPALGCLCVRRDSVDSGYNSEYAYLWPMEINDPRFMVYMGAPLSLEETGAIPIKSMSANNAHNVAALHYWAGSLSNENGGVAGGIWHFDPHELCDVSDDYVLTYYPDPADTTKPIGDFFHHKGTISLADGTLRTFTGYTNILADVPELNAADPFAEVLSITPSTNLTAVATNLFNEHNSSRPTLSAAATYTLENQNTGRTNLLLYDLNDASVTTGSVTFTRETIFQASQETTDFSFHKDTLAEVLRLNSWGNDDYDADDQDTACSTIASRALNLTPFGPRITFEQTISLNGSWWNSGATDDLFDDIYATPTTTGLTRKGWVQFDGYGWPIPERGLDPLTGPYFYANPANFSCRIARAYSGYRDGGHPNIVYPKAGPTGADFDFTSIGDNYTETNIKQQTNATLNTPEDLLDTDWRTWANPDSLVPGMMPRIPLLSEHFNGICQVLNSVKRITPTDFRKLKMVVDGAAVDFPPANFSGPWNGVMCPREMYCSFLQNSATHLLFISLGVPILTEADLPADWAAARGLNAITWFHGIQITDEVLSSTGAPAYIHTVRRSITGTFNKRYRAPGSHFDLPPHHATLYGIGAVEITTPFYWVSISDVKAAVEALGWKFAYQYGFSLHKISTYLLSSPSVLYGLSAPVQYETQYYDAGNLIEYPAGTKFVADEGFSYDDAVAAFVDAEDGEWKQRQATPSVIDAKAGDIASAAIFDGIFEKYFIYKFETPDDIRRWMGNGNPAIEDYRKQFLFQNYYSSGITNDSVAFKVPVTWVKHSQDDLSGTGYANALLRWGVAGGGADYPAGIPMEASAKTGSASHDPLTEGDTVISFEEGRALEVVPLVQTYVSVD